MGFFQKSKNQEHIKQPPAFHPTFFKKEKIPKNELNYIQPLPSSYSKKMTEGVLICMPEKINRV